MSRPKVVPTSQYQLKAADRPHIEDCRHTLTTMLELVDRWRREERNEAMLIAYASVRNQLAHQLRGVLEMLAQLDGKAIPKRRAAP